MFIVGEQYAFQMLEPHPEQGWGHSDFVATEMAVDGPRIKVDWGGKEIIINTSHATLSRPRFLLGKMEAALACNEVSTSASADALLS
jgi:hypothetical protein